MKCPSVSAGPLLHLFHLLVRIYSPFVENDATSSVSVAPPIPVLGS